MANDINGSLGDVNFSSFSFIMKSAQFSVNVPDSNPFNSLNLPAAAICVGEFVATFLNPPLGLRILGRPFIRNNADFDILSFVRLSAM